MWVIMGQCGSVWVSLGGCGSVWISEDQFRSVWVGVYGLIWLGVGQFGCASVLVRMGQCGSVWVGVYCLIWLGVGSSDADSLESVQLRTRVRSVLNYHFRAGRVGSGRVGRVGS